MTSFEGLWKCHCLNLSKNCLRLRPAPTKCLSERINWIISIIPHRISKILFAYSSYEFLAMLEGKIRETPFLKVQSSKITVFSSQFQTWFKIAVFYPKIRKLFSNLTLNYQATPELLTRTLSKLPRWTPLSLMANIRLKILTRIAKFCDLRSFFDTFHFTIFHFNCVIWVTYYPPSNLFTIQVNLFQKHLFLH